MADRLPHFFEIPTAEEKPWRKNDRLTNSFFRLVSDAIGEMFRASLSLTRRLDTQYIAKL